jgi:hypothetical protein
MTLLLLACTLLWGSLLLLTLSDAYAASNEFVEREQSRLLAYSGWNLALQQLETTGDITAVQLEQPAGTAQVSLQAAASGLITVQAEGVAKAYHSQVQGKVRLLTFPWQEIDDWTLVENLQDLQEPSLFLSSTAAYTLATNCDQPLAIGYAENGAFTVTIAEPLTLDVLYVHGDLELTAPVTAAAVYVSGQMSGAEQLDCAEVHVQSATTPSYRVRVVERTC